MLAFEVNADIVKNPPQDWSDLLKPEYANMVALAGDPRTSNQAIMGMFAAGLSASGGDVDNAAEAGPELLRRAQQERQLRAGRSARRPPLAQGTTPIVIRWDYLRSPTATR